MTRSAVRAVALASTLLAVAPLLLAVPQGPFYASTLGLSQQWTNNDRALGATLDGLCASSDTVGNSIDLTGFGFSIPPAAIINGIIVEPKFANTTLSSGTAASATLLKAGTPVGSVKTFGRPGAADSCGGINPSAFLTLGNAADQWGTSWTPTEINAANFGVRFTKAGTGTAHVDAVRITVEYQDVMQVAMEVGGTLSATVSQSNIELGRVEFTGQTTLRATATRNWRVRATVTSNSFPTEADDPTPNAVQIRNNLGSFQSGGTPGVIVRTGTPTPAEGETFTVDIRVLLNMFGDGKTTPPPYLFNVAYTIEDNP